MNLKYISSFLLITLACSPKSEQTISITSVPEWSKSAIYYQIFVERFRNGDPTNDPTIADIQKTFPEDIPNTWVITPWGMDWYKADSYHSEMDSTHDFYGKIQLRRYGGDLQGVLDKIDYIADLGINAIYFNPLNDAPSLHKYDPRYYHHMDRNFGPNPRGDVAMMNAETPSDPTTWQWTAADRQFLEVIKTFHSRGIRVILDYSFNHTGYDFWAVNDIRKNGKESKFVDWYEVNQFDDTTTLENETEIQGWWGFKYLPLFQEKLDSPNARPPHEGNMVSNSLKQHLFDVSRRWLDPNGDGNFEDGVDGYRMDVAAEVTMGFWREYRSFIKSVNPDALLIGEVWWFDDKDMSGPEKMVAGDAFDGLMNYRWYRQAHNFFSQGDAALKPSEFVAKWKEINVGVTPDHQMAMMNIAGTHDTPRIGTSFFNDSPFNEKSKLSENAAYKVQRPDEMTWKEVDMFLLHQYSFVGSPQIWNGDELGMWGANDPDCRKPLWWQDISFEFESAQAVSPRIAPADTIKPDLKRYALYQSLTAIRFSNPVLSTGDLKFLLADDTRMCLAYSRFNENDEVIAAFNRSDEVQQIELEARGAKYINLMTDEKYSAKNGKLTLSLNAIEGALLKAE